MENQSNSAAATTDGVQEAQEVQATTLPPLISSEEGQIMFNQLLKEIQETCNEFPELKINLLAFNKSGSIVEEAYTHESVRLENVAENFFGNRHQSQMTSNAHAAEETDDTDRNDSDAIQDHHRHT